MKTIFKDLSQRNANDDILIKASLSTVSYLWSDFKRSRTRGGKIPPETDAGASASELAWIGNSFRLAIWLAGESTPTT
jgi:hypothetical protein